MHTGYYAQLKSYLKCGLHPVSISVKCPDWYNGSEYKKLAPKWEFFNEWKNGSHKGDNEYFIKNYKELVLDKLEPAQVMKELEELTGASLDKIIFLCYEKPEDFCHRHLVADWFNAAYKTCKKMIPSIKLKDYLISLGYKIENRNDFMDACIKEQFRLLDKESRETVDEFPV